MKNASLLLVTENPLRLLKLQSKKTKWPVIPQLMNHYGKWQDHGRKETEQFILIPLNHSLPQVQCK